MIEPGRCNASRRAVLAGALALWPGAALARMADPAGVAATPEPPERIDLSGLMTPVKDQGERMTCAPFATTAAVEATILRDLGVRIDLSEEFVTQTVWQGRTPNPDETMSNQAAANVFMEVGAVPEAAMPYRTQRESTPPSPELIAQAARIKVEWTGAIRGSEGWGTPPVDSQRLAQMMRLLGIRRAPQVFAARLPPENEGWGDDGVLRVPARFRGVAETELDLLPNHFTVLTGYDRAAGQFMFKNSWGREWGQSGYGTIDFETMASPWIVAGSIYVRPINPATVTLPQAA